MAGRGRAAGRPDGALATVRCRPGLPRPPYVPARRISALAATGMSSEAGRGVVWVAPVMGCPTPSAPRQRATRRESREPVSPLGALRRWQLPRRRGQTVGRAAGDGLDGWRGASTGSPPVAARVYTHGVDGHRLRRNRRGQPGSTRRRTASGAGGPAAGVAPQRPSQPQASSAPRARGRCSPRMHLGPAWPSAVLQRRSQTTAQGSLRRRRDAPQRTRSCLPRARPEPPASSPTTACALQASECSQHRATRPTRHGQSRAFTAVLAAHGWNTSPPAPLESSQRSQG